MPSGVGSGAPADACRPCWITVQTDWGVGAWGCLSSDRPLPFMPAVTPKLFSGWEASKGGSTPRNTGGGGGAVAHILGERFGSWNLNTNQSKDTSRGRHHSTTGAADSSVGQF